MVSVTEVSSSRKMKPPKLSKREALKLDSDVIKRVRDARWKLGEVALAEMQVNPRAQRDFREPWALKLLSDFSPDAMGLPVVNIRNGIPYVCDGQHRIHAVKAWLGEWKTQKLTCRIYEGLTEAEEAELYLLLNYTRPPSAYEIYSKGLTAGREVQVGVHGICLSLGISVVRNAATYGRVSEAALTTSAVSSLMRNYEHFGAPTLKRALRIICSSLSSSGLKGPMITAVCKICQRYTEFHDEHMIERLTSLRGGMSALAHRVSMLERSLGQPKTECLAGALVESYNVGLSRGRKLADWWKKEEDE